MKTIALALAAAAGLFLASPSQSQAQWGYYGGYQPYYGHYHHNVNPYRYYPGGHLHWHDTSHFHYQPPTVYRHFNHYHVNPGGYYLHRNGHWDLHH